MLGACSRANGTKHAMNIDAQLQSNAGQPNGPVPRTAMKNAGDVDLEGKKIAVVDDDLAVCESTRALLEVYGMEVETYQVGSDFLRDDPKVACVIIDYHMPGLNGLEVVSDLRKRGSTVPVIMITALSDPTIEKRAAALGITHVLRKPIVGRTLLDTIIELSC